MAMMILHAPNVHCGGGLTLLQSVLKALPKQSYLIVDERFPLSDEMDGFFQIKRVKASLGERFKAEVFLSKLVQHGDDVLCFGNLPPLFKLKGNVRLFLQNRYLVDDVSISNFSFKIRVRIMMERLWLKCFVRNVDRVIVQTPSMQTLFEKKFSIPSNVSPFVADSEQFVRVAVMNSEGSNKTYEFIYVASGEPHKNHRNLIKAWSILAQQGLCPSLTLTLNKALFPELIAWIEKQQFEHDLNITNLGILSGDEVQNLYRNAQTLIFPSTLESFGIPLIEARNAGLAIVASELDFVRDIVDQEESFDPESAVSIARAVKRFLGEKEETLQLLDGKAFLHTLFDE